MSSENTDQKINILWTGGWDSTFRMIQLARMGANIQPYYVIHTGRRSTLKEIQQIYIIKADISHKYPECTINDLKLIEVSTINIDSRIQEAHERMTNAKYMGPQYIWLAALAEQIDGLELSIHKDDKAEYFARKILQNEVAPDSDEQVIFGNFRFPLIDFTKLEMEHDAKQTHDDKILFKSWFCHDPIKGTPCGLCGPCRYAFAEGMQKRFTRRGKLYHRFPKLFLSIRKAARKYV